MVTCFYCGSPMIWQSDFSFEDYGLETDGIVSVHVCSNEDCQTLAEFYTEFPAQTKSEQQN